jgi:hypothetical protein
LREEFKERAPSKEAETWASWLDFENTSPQGQSIVGLSRLDFEDTSQVQSTARPYSTMQLKKGCMTKNKVINKNNWRSYKITNQRWTPSGHQSVSGVAMDSIASETELVREQWHHRISAEQTFHRQKPVIKDK